MAAKKKNTKTSNTKKTTKKVVKPAKSSKNGKISSKKPKGAAKKTGVQAKTSAKKVATRLAAKQHRAAVAKPIKTKKVADTKSKTTGKLVSKKLAKAIERVFVDMGAQLTKLYLSQHYITSSDLESILDKQISLLTGILSDNKAFFNIRNTVTGRLPSKGIGSASAAKIQNATAGAEAGIAVASVPTTAVKISSAI